MVYRKVLLDKNGPESTSWRGNQLFHVCQQSTCRLATLMKTRFAGETIRCPNVTNLGSHTPWSVKAVWWRLSRGKCCFAAGSSLHGIKTRGWGGRLGHTRWTSPFSFSPVASTDPVKAAWWRLSRGKCCLAAGSSLHGIKTRGWGGRLGHTRWTSPFSFSPVASTDPVKAAWWRLSRGKCC